MFRSVQSHLLSVFDYKSQVIQTLARIMNRGNKCKMTQPSDHEHLQRCSGLLHKNHVSVSLLLPWTTHHTINHQHWDVNKKRWRHSVASHPQPQREVRSREVDVDTPMTPIIWQLIKQSILFWYKNSTVPSARGSWTSWRHDCEQQLGTQS